MTERVIHAERGEEKIVRYDRAGKWFIEFDPPRGRSAEQVPFRQAVDRAWYLWGAGGVVHFDRPGGRRFDSDLRRRSVELYGSGRVQVTP